MGDLSRWNAGNDANHINLTYKTRFLIRLNWTSPLGKIGGKDRILKWTLGVSKRTVGFGVFERRR